MRADLARLFHVDLDDVLSGRVGVRHALMLLGRSRQYPDSLMREHDLGPELARWDKTTDAIAHMTDLMASLIVGMPGSKAKFNDIRFQRPKLPGSEDSTLFAPTIADFDVGRFMRIINNN